MIRVPHQQNPHFTREQIVDRHGRYVRWACVEPGVRIEVVATEAGVTVQGGAKNQPTGFSAAMCECLELAAYAHRQMAGGTDVMNLRF
jgi:hypothetical protein